MVETTGGEPAIWWNGHHLLQIGISHGGMPSRGPSFWIPLALSTAHRPSVLPHPRVYFGFACCCMRSLLRHLCPPWSYYDSLKSLPKPWKWFKVLFIWFCEFRMTKDKEVRRTWPCFDHGLWYLSSSYDLCACGLSFLAHSIIKLALAERASPTHTDWKLTFNSFLKPSWKRMLNNLFWILY